MAVIPVHDSDPADAVVHVVELADIPVQASDPAVSAVQLSPNLLPLATIVALAVINPLAE